MVSEKRQLRWVWLRVLAVVSFNKSVVLIRKGEALIRLKHSIDSDSLIMLTYVSILLPKST